MKSMCEGPWLKVPGKGKGLCHSGLQQHCTNTQSGPFLDLSCMEDFKESVKQTLSSLSSVQFILVVLTSSPFQSSSSPNSPYTLCPFLVQKQDNYLYLTFGSFWTNHVSNKILASNCLPFKEFYKPIIFSPQEFIHQFLKYLVVPLPFHL